MTRTGGGSYRSASPAARIAGRQHAGPEIGSHSVTGAGPGPVCKYPPLCTLRNVPQWVRRAAQISSFCAGAWTGRQPPASRGSSCQAAIQRWSSPARSGSRRGRGWLGGVARRERGCGRRRRGRGDGPPRGPGRLSGDMTSASLAAPAYRSAGDLMPRLEARRDTLAAQPVVPASVERRPTGETFACRWEQLDDDGRRQLVASVGFRIGGAMTGDGGCGCAGHRSRHRQASIARRRRPAGYPGLAASGVRP